MSTRPRTIEEKLLAAYREIELVRAGTPFHKHTDGSFCKSPYCSSLSDPADPAHMLDLPEGPARA